ncbi:MAG: hypothetical protein Q8M92_09625, partial [Candidatus Subteraquimicrobiales bacterium]|nr:hypothetical protein [Candidatus Subteraquimicrobiales bacterium]
KLISSKDPIAISALQRAGDQRPVLVNRAPSISEGSVTAHYPIFVDKLNINVPTVFAQFQKGDFDGDTLLCDIHLRVSNVHSLERRLRFLLALFNPILYWAHNLLYSALPTIKR